jgi:hypothetical protein
MTSDLLNQLLELPTRERAAIAYELLLSFEPDDPDAGAAWNAELGARLDKIEQEDFVATDWKEALERIRLSLPRGDAP